VKTTCGYAVKMMHGEPSPVMHMKGNQHYLAARIVWEKDWLAVMRIVQMAAHLRCDNALEWEAGGRFITDCGTCLSCRARKLLKGNK